MVGVSRSHATARRAAIEAVATSWTMGDEEDGIMPAPVHCG
jgi:hypothetical protein